MAVKPGKVSKVVSFDRLKSVEEQFEMIYTEQFDRLYFFARTMVKSDQLAEDIIAEVFLNLWKNRHRFNEIKQMDSYLFIAVKNQATRILYEEPNKLEATILDNTVRFMDKVDPEELLLAKELSDSLETIVATLPEQCQLIFNMARNQHLKYQEIADELGISISTVRTQLTKASSIIRKYLYDRYHETQSSDNYYRNINHALIPLLISQAAFLFD
ncbi:MAG: RNA polymerase sigma-70 factor [Cyclobacteriaceae bacterium]|nr:RNA polymerase sigma-70 factor [Cyclobacteriaceae bacterium SS2]